MLEPQWFINPRQLPDNQVARRAFTERDVELLQAFSIQAAISLEKALLHRGLQENYVQTVTALRQEVAVKDS